MNRQEKQVERAARYLVKALCSIEAYDGDPEDIISDAYMQLRMRDPRSELKGVKHTLDIIRSHYEE